MKKTLLALALAAATMPFTFAAQAPNTDKPATETNAPAKKHVKKHAKHNKKANRTAQQK